MKFNRCNFLNIYIYIYFSIKNQRSTSFHKTPKKASSIFIILLAIPHLEPTRILLLQTSQGTRNNFLGGEEGALCSHTLFTSGLVEYTLDTRRQPPIEALDFSISFYDDDVLCHTRWRFFEQACKQHAIRWPSGKVDRGRMAQKTDRVSKREGRNRFSPILSVFARPTFAPPSM